LDAEPQNETSTRWFDAEIFDPDTGFGGNGYPVAATPDQNRLNITGNTGGGCVMNGPFAPPHFIVNVPTPHCLTRDFVPWIVNRMADKDLVEEVLAQPDYTSIAKTVEKLRAFDPPNIHASGHFGIGGILGTMGNAAESPGGECLILHVLTAPICDMDMSLEHMLIHDRSSFLPPSWKHRPHLLGMATERSEEASQSSRRAHYAF
jgi:tyrosinase